MTAPGGDDLNFNITATTSDLENALAPLERSVTRANIEVNKLAHDLEEIDGMSVDIDIDLKQQVLAKLRNDLRTLKDYAAEGTLLNIDVRDADREIRRIERQINDLTKAERKAASEFGRMWAEAHRINAQMDAQRVRDLKRINDELDRTRRAWDRVHGAALKLDAEVDKNRLSQTLEGQLGSAATGVFAFASKLGIQFVGAFSRAIAAAGPEVAIAALAIIGVVAYTITAGIASAVSGALAAGGLTLGLVAAFQDPAVQTAVEGLTMRMQQSFARMGEGLRVPVLEALSGITDAIDKAGTVLQPAFAKLAPFVLKIGDAIENVIGMLSNELGGFLDTAGPIFDAIAFMIDWIGRGIAIFMKIMSSQSEGAALGLRLLAMAINNIIISLGLLLGFVLFPLTGFSKLLKLLGDGFAWLESKTTGWLRILVPLAPMVRKIIDLVVGTGNAAEDSGAGLELFNNANKEVFYGSEEAAKALQKEEEAAKKAAQEMERIAAATQRAADATGRLAQELFDAQMSSDRATVGLARGWLNLNKTLSENKKTLDLNTESGVNNADALLDMLDNIERVRQNEQAMGVSFEVANKHAADSINRLENVAVKAGLGAKAVGALTAEYKLIPSMVETQILTDLRGAENLDLMEQKLAEIFGPDVVHKLKVQVEEERLNKQIQDVLGDFEGVTMSKLIKADPETFGGVIKDTLSKIDKTIKVEMIAAPSVQATIDDTKAKIVAITTTKYEVPIFAKMDLATWSALVITLAAITQKRFVEIVPYVTQDSLRNLRNTFASAATVAVTPRVNTGRPQGESTGTGTFGTRAIVSATNAATRTLSARQVQL